MSELQPHPLANLFPSMLDVMGVDTTSHGDSDGKLNLG